VAADSRIRPPAYEYWSVHCLPASSRPLYVDAVSEDSCASVCGTHDDDFVVALLYRPDKKKSKQT